MDKQEIVTNIKEKTEDYMFQSEIDAYIKGYLDALFRAYEITWEERFEIEEVLKNE